MKNIINLRGVTDDRHTVTKIVIGQSEEPILTLLLGSVVIVKNDIDLNFWRVSAAPKPTARFHRVHSLNDSSSIHRLIDLSIAGLCLPNVVSYDDVVRYHGVIAAPYNEHINYTLPKKVSDYDLQDGPFKFTKKVDGLCTYAIDDKAWKSTFCDQDHFRRCLRGQAVGIYIQPSSLVDAQGLAI